MSKAVIELQNVTKKYKKNGVDIKVLDNVSYKFFDKKFYSIMGASGNGKSTLMNIICGLLKFDNGTIKYFDKFINKKVDYDYLRNKKIGLIYQTFLLNDDLTAYDNVLLPLLVEKGNTNSNDLLVKSALTKVGLVMRMNHYPSELSGGEMQRVAIARALINNPDIILADEPTGNLDPKNSWEIMKLLEEINNRGTTVIVVTHNSEIVDAMQKRVVTIHKGMIVSDEQAGGYIYED